MHYIASPYTSPLRSVQGQRMAVVAKWMARALTQHPLEVFYSPILHFHHMAYRHKLPTDASFWQFQNLGMLTIAESLLILTMPHWEESKGIRYEMAKAQTFKLPIRLINPNVQTITLGLD